MLYLVFFVSSQQFGFKLFKIMKANSLLSTLCLALSAVLVSSTANAQNADNYKVVKVQGEIQRVKTGNLLSTGENVSSDENFNFKTNYSRAIVVNKEKGCVILAAQANNSGAQFLPSTNNMSVRAAIPSQPSEILEYYYGEIVVTGFDSILIDEEKLKINGDSYFTVKYNADSSEISERVVCKDEKLVFPESILEKKPQKVTLCYNDEFGESGKTEFSPVFVEAEMLKVELDLIFSTLNCGRDEKIDAATEYVNSFYGKTTKEAVEAWVKNNMNL